jgi:uncharacterized membrane protein
MALADAPLTFASIRRALAHGIATTQRTRAVSLGYAGVFAVGGAFILLALIKSGMTPLALVAASAFTLIGPIVLAGFFGIARADELQQRAGADAVFNGFHDPPGGLWAIALVCMVFFMIFVFEATLGYGLAVSAAPSLPPVIDMTTFVVWTLLSGTLIAVLLFSLSAFSVPLVCEHRATLVEAIAASLRVVARNFAVTMTWALILATATIGSIILLPLFLFVLPVLAYASHALYREALPPGR